MLVLKKFGFLIIIGLLIVHFTYAQQAENCYSIPAEIKAKKDPIDFIHNNLLKVSGSNPVPAAKNLYSSAVSKNLKSEKVSKVKSQRFAIKTVNEQAKISLERNSKEKKSNTTNVETSTVSKAPVPIEKKSTSSINANTVSASSSIVCNDVPTRFVTKTLSPKVAVTKNEEVNFGTTMMEWVKDKYSSMIDVLPNQISNVMLYRFIDDWYGVKYRMGGTSKKGVDCSAFVQTLYKYVFGTDLLRTACLQFNAAELIKNPADLKEGDLVFFRVNTSRISHVGVYLRNNFFVHSASSKGVSIANLSSIYWSKYFAGGGRILQKS